MLEVYGFVTIINGFKTIALKSNDSDLFDRFRRYCSREGLSMEMNGRDRENRDLYVVID